MSNVATNVIETHLKHDGALIACFECTSYLLEFAKSDNDKKIKLQGIESKIKIPLDNIY